jgi:hypothetical protein
LLPDLFGKAVPQAEISVPLSEDEFLTETPQEDYLYEEPAQLAINPGDTPIYYLRSIIYLSENSWTVWFGDERLSSTEEARTIDSELYGSVEVIAVYPKRIVVVWNGFPADMINAQFKDTMYHFKDSLYVSQDMQILYDAEAQRVAALIQPNQAIICHLLRIVEGENNANNLLVAATAIGQEVPIEASVDTGEALVTSESQQEISVVTFKPITVKELFAKTPSRPAEQRQLKEWKRQLDLLQRALLHVKN